MTTAAPVLPSALDSVTDAGDVLPGELPSASYVGDRLARLQRIKDPLTALVAQYAESLLGFDVAHADSLKAFQGFSRHARDAATPTAGSPCETDLHVATRGGNLWDMPAAIAVTDLAPFDQVTLAATPLIVGRVTAPFRDVHGVERVWVCGLNAVTGRNTAIPAAVDTAAVVS